MNRNLTDKELSIVYETIASHLGLYFPIERRATHFRSLVSAARALGFKNMNGFIKWISSPDINQDQMELLATHLTISETYFWREPQVFSALIENILPELIESKKNGEKNIRIWSAGCSTGEEPYSLAIAIHKTIPKIKDWNIKILATDINPIALNKARKGAYSSGSFRNSPKWLKSDYFKSSDNKEYKIIPEISKLVTFSSFNLIQEDFLSSVCTNKKTDIIFCRNVLMYLTNEWASRISQNLFNSLKDDGWLVVSSCELSSNLFPQFVPVNFPGAVLYRKTKNSSSPSFSFRASTKEDLQSFNSSTFQPVLPLQTSSSEALPKEDHQPPQLFNPSSIQPLSSEASPKEESSPIVKAHEKSIDERIIAIRLLANQGHLEEALSTCNKAITTFKLTPGLYLLRASILQEMDNSTEAIASLRQAIYIDPNYIMGHFTLGNLFFRQGKIKYSKLYFNNALELLSTCLDDNILDESEGLSAKYLREIIRNHLQSQNRT